MLQESLRRRTFNDPGHAHELTFSTYRRSKLLTDETLCRMFLENLERARTAHSFEVWAFVLMPDHVHLLIWPKQLAYCMSTIRTAIKHPFARSALKLLESTGDPRLETLTARERRHFWQTGGGYDRNIHSRAACVNSIQYIHNNPVTAGLTDLAWDYPWSSARSYHGLESNFPVDMVIR